MSIKKLFESTNEGKNYLSETDQREAFKSVESSTNAIEIKRRQDSFLPQIDYSEPTNFAKYGSAYLYYKGAFERILDYYPYDGSDAELNKFYNDSLGIEKYIFNDIYPRTAGYILLSADGWGTRVGGLSGAYGRPDTLEYIQFVGGPNTASYTKLSDTFNNPEDSKFQHSNVYDTNIYQTAGLPNSYGSGSRESNLKSDFDTGVTVEFWLKKAAFDNVNTQREVVLDIWNNAASSSTDYGRLTIELAGAASGSPFLITAQSGTAGFLTASIGQNLDTDSLTSWGHYALVFQNVNSCITTKLYVDGYLNDIYTTGSAGWVGSAATLSALKTKNMQGRIGSFLSAPSGAAETYGDPPAAWAGMAKLSASMDEFRFWKVARTGEEIGRHWFTQVHGGANTDISNATLGLYYKFNEGISTDTAIDSVVLDYSGRLGNGVWTGYDSASRNTGSAILEASASTKEYLDPIIYATHPSVSALKTALLNSGSYHDSNNNNSFLSLMPSWLIESDEADTSDLRKLTHIAGTYFDKLFLQISALPGLKALNYTSGSDKPFPFAQHFPQSLGLYAPEIFIDASVMEKFLNRDNDTLFESNLNETKNLIYLNLYNNLANIYKNKGTEKSIRNVFRCFNIDDRLIRLNVYSDNQVFELKNNLKQTLTTRKSINQNRNENLAGTIVQYCDSGKASTTAAAADALKITGGTVWHNDAFTVLVPTAAGGLGITATVMARNSMGSTPSANQIHWYLDPSGDAAKIANLKLAINGTSDTSKVKFGSGITNGATVGIKGLTASDGTTSAETYVNLTADNAGTAGNEIAIADSVGTVLVNESALTDGKLAGGTDSNFLAYISGSSTDGMPGSVYPEDKYGFTAEADITFPAYDATTDPVVRNYTDVSLFGIYQFDGPSIDGTQATASTSTSSVDVTNFQVYAVKPFTDSKNVYFKLTSSNDPYPFPTLTSSIFFDTYDDTHWNISVRVKPSNYPLTDVVTGATSYTYDVEFRGVKEELGVIGDSFSLTGSMTKAHGTGSVRAHKRLYAGARRTNMTGTILQYSDVLLNNCRFWLKHLDDGALDQHAFASNNVGLSGSYQNLSPLDTNNAGYNILNPHTLALNWNFGKVTGSGPDGEFAVIDMSSGSADLRNNFGWLGSITGYQHTGRGFSYEVSSSNVVKEQTVNSFKFINPESPVSSDMIQILSEDDKLYGIDETVPSFFYTIEKSIYNAISEEMLTFFAGVIDFNNLIGEPVNRYRSEYKSLEKLREVFFRKVTTVKSVEKYIDYYKWFDDSIATILAQLLPASAEYVADVYNIIESHVLERNKYQSQFPSLEEKSSTEAPMMGINKLTYNWKFNHHPVDDSQAKNSDWWRERAERSGSSVISSGDNSIDSERDIVRESAKKDNKDSFPVFRKNDRTAYYRLSYVKNKLAKPYQLETKHTQVYKGGINFTETKNLTFTFNALYPAGPVNESGSVYVPRNVLFGDIDEIVNVLNTSDIKKPRDKTKKVIKVQHGRDWEDGIGPKNVKSSYAFPFNILSSSTDAVVTTGYGKQVTERLRSDLEVVNLHFDAYGPDLEVPMQGPFTNHVVGGLQYRHVAINTGSDNYLNRPEGWKLLLGKYVGVTGAIGMVGCDYPWPEANEEGVTPYPMTGAQKAYLYRDHVAKRPVNIRNIKHRTGSTILGNYNHNYEVVSTVGAYQNPRQFVENQPSLPSQITDTPSASQGRTMFGTRRTAQNHVQLIPDYSIAYLTSSTNKSIIKGRFRAPGGIKVQGRGYQDIRSAELSVYNALNYRNLSVKKPSQTATGSISEPTGSGTPGIRVYNIHGKDYGLRAMLTRHCGKFGRDSFLVTDPGATDNQSASFIKVPRNTKTVIVSGSNAYSTGSKFDNFWVQRQTPRSDRQYAWVTGSIVNATDIRYYGYAPVYGPQAGTYSSSADGYTAYFSYVSGSSVVGSTVPTIYQPEARLAIFTVDPVDNSTSDPNVLGHPSTSDNIDYFNNTLMDKFGILAEINPRVDYFNVLMANRRAGFGWSWTSARNGDHPILVKHRNNNNYSVYNGEAITDYNLYPVSLRGRPVVLSMNIGNGAETIIQTTHNNETIYFTDTTLNNLQFPAAPAQPTPLSQLLEINRSIPSVALNWLLYSENLFPAARNQFSSSTTGRTGYDNKFWRDASHARVTLGNTLPNSFGLTVSQSCWLLDAQSNFLTRTSVPGITASGEYTQLIGNGSSGELQNNYFHIVSGSAARTAGANAVRSLAASGLYSRKHVLSSPQSIVSPSGINIPATGSIPIRDIFENTIDVFGGEAVWEADSQAGIVVKSGSVSTFESHSSEPWFDEYADFKQELKLMAKDYSIVPEFRISEHVDKYERYGLFNRNDFGTFTIPGTSLSSSQSDFYKDYSNSEFMSGFLKIKNDSLLNATQIKLVCSGVIRFNPYKGFYPAQRTLDLIAQFSSSYGKSFSSKKGNQIVQHSDGHLRPLMQTLYSPGILYNSIKSGIAVNYPIVLDETKVRKTYFGTAHSESTNNWMITSANTASTDAEEGYAGGQYWDYKIPFETLLAPERYLDGLEFIDLEPHPSASLDITSSFAVNSNDSIYSRMAENFFGEVGGFFLKDSGFTKLESQLVTSDLEFVTGSTYFARLKIRKSAKGARTYQHESGAAGNNSTYTTFGGKSYFNDKFRSGSYPLPQDPRQNPSFKESFTMYSRPTAFGPPIAARPSGSEASLSVVRNTYPLDGLSGFNGAYTPPYYNGEAWVDFIFRPQGDTKYDLEKILTETKTVLRRMDPGVSASVGTTSLSGTQLIATFSGSDSFPTAGDLIYEGKNINANSMQLSASVNYFGIERVLKQRTDKFGNEILTENETAGKKWIIQPKFETPMLNFNDEGVHPITDAAGNVTLPTFGSASVPRGMWHQFGVIPDTPDKGVFLEIGDIPTTWLKNHYDVIYNNSIYNDNNASTNGANLHKRAQSLTDIIKFVPQQTTARLGEIAESRKIKEAVIAVPYIVEYTAATGELATQRKRFISIPSERIAACLSGAVGSVDGDSLTTAGPSIRRQVDKMQEYVFPPQFDFLSSAQIAPMVMYIFEFEYTLDKDDLSYIWQNLAPRNFRKITRQVASVAHELMDTELLSESNLMDNENLRWMVFKVKQKSTTKYSDLVAPQAGQSTGEEIATTEDTGYNIAFNWPYDYLSFVELIKIDAQVLYKNSRSGSL